MGFEASRGGSLLEFACHALLELFGQGLLLLTETQVLHMPGTPHLQPSLSLHMIPMKSLEGLCLLKPFPGQAVAAP